jgi:hypothetical protein
MSDEQKVHWYDEQPGGKVIIQEEETRVGITVKQLAEVLAALPDQDAIVRINPLQKGRVLPDRLRFFWDWSVRAEIVLCGEHDREVLPDEVEEEA